MLGFLLTTGVGVLGFKLGMDAKEMLDEGCSAGDVLASIPCNAARTVRSAAIACKDAVANWIPGCRGKSNGKNPPQDKPTGGSKKKQAKKSTPKKSPPKKSTPKSAAPETKAS